MEKWIKNISSVLLVGFFGLLALACYDEESGGPPQPENCDDPILVLKEPLTSPVTSVNHYNLTLLDKETGLPIPGIYVKAHWNQTFCEGYDNFCVLYCTMQVPIYEGNNAEHTTDANGVIDGQTFPYEFKDKKDRVLVTFDIEDTHGVYVSKRISFRYDYSQTSRSYIGYMLKKDAL